MTTQPLGWIGVVRLGLVQSALGAIVVLTTSTLNRVMQVELALPAIIPGLLIGLHYAVQVTRPRMGFGSDAGGRRTPWIIGGMAVLAVGGIAAAIATVWMMTNRPAGLVLAVAAFLAIGAGVSATGTTLLVLLAKRTSEHQRAASATIVWLMMIAGFAITALAAGQALEPYSPRRLIEVTATVSIAAFLLATLAVWGVEGPIDEAAGAASLDNDSHRTPFRQALGEVWSEPQARTFTIFVFVSMLAYSGQELILEPFAGAIFGFTPGQSTKLAGLQHGGVFAGMVLVAIGASLARGTRFASLRLWAVGGCVASALALLGLFVFGMTGIAWPLRSWVFVLGLANGVFAIAAIGQMMSFASQGHKGREGVRMGLWGAAQGIAFGCGGLVGAAASDLAKLLFASPATAYAWVFALEALLFLYSAALAARLQATPQPQQRPVSSPVHTHHKRPRAMAATTAFANSHRS